MRMILLAALVVLGAGCGSTRYFTIPMTTEGNTCQRECSTQSNTCLQARPIDFCNSQLGMCASSCPGAATCETDPKPNAGATKCSDLSGKVFFVKDTRGN